jgi:hypothetical protein
MESDIREAVEALSFWLDEKNASARKELAERNPPLEAWLDMVQKKVQERMAQVEQEREMKI